MSQSTERLVFVYGAYVTTLPNWQRHCDGGSAKTGVRDLLGIESIPPDPASSECTEQKCAGQELVEFRCGIANESLCELNHAHEWCAPFADRESTRSRKAMTSFREGRHLGGEINRSSRTMRGLIFRPSPQRPRQREDPCLMSRMPKGC